MSGFQFIHYEKYKKDDIAGIIGEASRTPAIALTSKNVQAPTILKGNLEELQVRLQHDVAHYKKLSKDGKLKRFETTPISCSPGFFLSGCDSKTR